jgi:hypothetical protein
MRVAGIIIILSFIQINSAWSFQKKVAPMGPEKRLSALRIITFDQFKNLPTDKAASYIREIQNFLQTQENKWPKKGLSVTQNHFQFSLGALAAATVLSGNEVPEATSNNELSEILKSPPLPVVVAQLPAPPPTASTAAPLASCNLTGDASQNSIRGSHERCTIGGFAVCLDLGTPGRVKCSADNPEYIAISKANGCGNQVACLYPAYIDKTTNGVVCVDKGGPVCPKCVDKSYKPEELVSHIQNPGDAAKLALMKAQWNKARVDLLTYCGTDSKPANPLSFDTGDCTSLTNRLAQIKDVYSDLAAADGKNTANLGPDAKVGCKDINTPAGKVSLNITDGKFTMSGDPAMSSNYKVSLCDQWGRKVYNAPGINQPDFWRSCLVREQGRNQEVLKFVSPPNGDVSASCTVVDVVNQKGVMQNHQCTVGPIQSSSGLDKDGRHIKINVTGKIDFSSPASGPPRIEVVATNHPDEAPQTFLLAIESPASGEVKGFFSPALAKLGLPLEIFVTPASTNNPIDACWARFGKGITNAPGSDASSGTAAPVSAPNGVSPSNLRAI